MINIDACIVTYNSGSTIEAAIESLRFVPGLGCVRVIDNSNDPTIQEQVERVAADLGVDIDFVTNQKNLGFARGCNILAGRSNAEFLLFLNPDAELLNFPLTSAELRGTIYGPTVFSEEGKLSLNWANAPRTVRDELKVRILRQSERSPNGAGTVSGAVMVVDADVFDRLGQFDERYFMYYEDIDICTQAGVHGVRVFRSTEWWAKHVGGVSTKDRTRQALISYESARAYHQKWRHGVRAFDLLVLFESLCKMLLPGRRFSRLSYGVVAAAAGRNLKRRGDPSFRTAG